MLTGQQVQRLNSHIAALRPQFFPVLTHATQRLTQAFPAAGPGLDLSTATARHRAAASIAHVLKNLADLDDLAPFLEQAGAALARQGVDSAAAGPIGARAVLDAVKHASGDNWSPDLERDWRDLLAFVSTALARGSASTLARTPAQLRLAA